MIVEGTFFEPDSFSKKSDYTLLKLTLEVCLYKVKKRKSRLIRTIITVFNFISNVVFLAK